jgi:hypothetical protein
MVSRRYEAPIADRSNWITVEPNAAIGISWIGRRFSRRFVCCLTWPVRLDGDRRVARLDGVATRDGRPTVTSS